MRLALVCMVMALAGCAMLSARSDAQTRRALEAFENSGIPRDYYPVGLNGRFNPGAATLCCTTASPVGVLTCRDESVRPSGARFAEMAHLVSTQIYAPINAIAYIQAQRRPVRLRVDFRPLQGGADGEVKVSMPGFCRRD